MKKALAVLIIGITTLFLATSCGNREESETTTSSELEPSATYESFEETVENKTDVTYNAREFDTFKIKKSL